VVASDAQKRPDAVAAGRSLFCGDPEVVRCPYDALKAMREGSPVQWFDEIGAYAVTRYEDVVEVLRNATQFSNRYPMGPRAGERLAQVATELVQERPEVVPALTHAMEANVAVLLTTDPPVHSRQRSLVNRAFSPSAVKRMAPWIEDLAASLVDAFIDKASIELVTEYAVPLPVIVIAEALGIPVEHKDDFKRWSDAVTGSLGNDSLTKDELADLAVGRYEMQLYLGRVVDERAERPGDDLISSIVTARIDGEALSRPEVIQMVEQFLVAGNDTTTRLIAEAALQLALDPALADSLRKDLEAIPAFVDECLRFHPVVNGLFRQAIDDCEIGGVAIPGGSHLWLGYAAGNHDPEAFESPEHFVADRPTNPPHLGFGLGEHFCLGATLARTEGRIAIEQLLARTASIELAVPEQDLSYDESYQVHGLRALPLKITAA
jgi:cytochrome P450